MTKEQLDALEAWIVAIIRDERDRSDLIDSQMRFEWREAVETALWLKEKNDD